MNLRRMYIDPGSKSAGLAVFEGPRFVASDTITADHKDGFQRLRGIQILFTAEIVKYGPKEVYIEQLVRNTHIITHYSVGVIGTAAASAIIDVKPVISATIPIKSWQKFCGWTPGKGKLKSSISAASPLNEYKDKVSSEDELAAIGLGLFHLDQIGVRK